MTTIYFAGTGAMLMFSLGVAKYLKQNYHVEDASVLVVSGGGVAGAALLALDWQEFDNVAQRCSQLFDLLPGDLLANYHLGGIYRRVLEVIVTAERLPRLTNLQVATTLLPLLQRKTYTGAYDTVDQVVEHLQTSAYIPFYFLRPPYRHHLLEIDGGASVSTQELSSALRVTIAYSDEADVYYTSEPITDGLRFRTYAENMALYQAGYERAHTQRVLINRKLRRR